MNLENKILKAIVTSGLSIMPMEHCPNGEYEDYDEWDAVEVDDKFYDINFFSDGEVFFINAYPVDEIGDEYIVDYSTIYSIMHFKLDRKTNGNNS